MTRLAIFVGSFLRFLQGSLESLFHGPAAVKSSANRLDANPQFQCPVSKALGASVHSHPSRASSVPALNILRSPDAVFGAVVTIIVNTFERVIACGFEPHIGNEVLKRVHPSLAHLYPSGAVSFKSGIVRFIASPLHGVPRYKLGSAGHSMLNTSLAASLSLQASTRLSVASAEMVAGGKCGLSTPTELCIAEAFPKNLAKVVFPSNLQRSEPSKLLAGNILETNAAADRLKRSHSASLHAGLRMVRAGRRLRACSARFIIADYAGRWV